MHPDAEAEALIRVRRRLADTPCGDGGAGAPASCQPAAQGGVVTPGAELVVPGSSVQARVDATARVRPACSRRFSDLRSVMKAYHASGVLAVRAEARCSLRTSSLVAATASQGLPEMKSKKGKCGKVKKKNEDKRVGRMARLALGSDEGSSDDFSPFDGNWDAQCGDGPFEQFTGVVDEVPCLRAMPPGQGGLMAAHVQW